MRYLILVGPTRTGTTTLFRFLSSQRAFVPSLRKETNFFLGAMDGRTAFSSTVYEQCFADQPIDSQWLLEASPLYFAGAPSTAEAIRNTLNGDVRVLISYRAPVERFLSLYRHVITKRGLRQNTHRQSIEEFLEACVGIEQWRFPTDRNISEFGFVEGCYKEGVARWLRTFGQENVGVLDFRVLSRAEKLQLEMDALADWLGINRFEAPLVPTENQSREVRFNSVHRLALSLNDNLEGFFHSYPWFRAALRRMYYAANQRQKSRIEIDDELLKQLEQQYSLLNQGLDELFADISLGARRP